MLSAKNCNTYIVSKTTLQQPLLYLIKIMNNYKNVYNLGYKATEQHHLYNFVKFYFYHTLIMQAPSSQ